MSHSSRLCRNWEILGMEVHVFCAGKHRVSTGTVPLLPAPSSSSH